MILFTLLMIALIGVVVFVLATAGIVGGAFIITFADVIVCVVLVIALIKFLFFRKRK